MNHSRAARLGLQGIALTILTACGPSRDHFEDVYADRVCALYFECEEPLISEVYESEDACYDGSVEDRQEIDCEYDAKEARGCLHLVRTMDCEAFAEGDWMVECSTPYDCSGG